jgi:protein-tyrosine phosphatase
VASAARAGAAGERHLAWEGCFNVRDLGGLRGAGGRAIRRGALVRADALDRLTAAGWAALEGHGIRTVVDLRNPDQGGPDAAVRPDGITTVRAPFDRIDDRDFWDRWGDGPIFATPLYYRHFLERMPHSAADAVAAIARARPGGVVFHCAGGRDRTGLVAIVVLSVAGVAPEDIAADYALSADRQPARFAALGIEDPAPALEAFLRAEGTTAEAAVLGLLREVDVEACLRAGGLTTADMAALRERMLEPANGRA